MSVDLKITSSLFLTLLVVFSACTHQQSQKPSAIVEGQITVADSIDASRDFSGIEIAIIQKDSANMGADTLFYRQTDSTGHFSGIATFPEDRFYTLRIDRNQRQLGQTSIILAEGDTVQITAELPGLQQTLEITSNEHEALDQYQRVSRNYQRIARYIQSGGMKGDSARAELNKWANLFWEVYTERKRNHRQPIVAAVDAIDIYGSVDGQEMMKKIRQVRDNDEFAGVAARYGNKLPCTK
ncbi:MAG: hypothetical protein U5K69_25570 [Balneolaceae bacterium]|nr:hypothetical protein [Balneolaceae bacterium]